MFLVDDPFCRDRSEIPSLILHPFRSKMQNKPGGGSTVVHPISSLTPYQNRFHLALSILLFCYLF